VQLIETVSSDDVYRGLFRSDRGDHSSASAAGIDTLDGPIKPALGGYLHEHTKRWSETVAGYDGFLFVFPP
jgi:NAD(P)H-dependent FMN reductase